MSERPRLLVVAGPSASGKTDLALALARAIDGELVGADSVQVYRGFDIGSAKPTPEELGGVAHHLLDVVDPDEAIDAARYAALADAAIAEIASRGHVPIVVGGTGLWTRALLRGLVELPPPDPAIRAALEAEADAVGAPALHARLMQIDPAAAAAIHPNDRLRIVRALEVHQQTGTPIGALRAEHALGQPRYDTFVLFLDRPRDDLYARIRARTDAMLARGLVEETRTLLARWGPGVRAMGAVGYHEVRQHLEGTLAEADLPRAIAKATQIYTRRQRTWWGKDEVGYRGPPETALTDAALRARIDAFLTTRRA